MSTLDEAGKQRVIEALEATLASGLSGSAAAASDERAAAELDQDDSHSVDDVSQSDQAGDLKALNEQIVAHQESVIARVAALDFGAKDRVEPGAVIGFGGERYVVGVPAQAFEVDGATYEGIADDAPIYAAIAGLRAGDEFTFRDQTHTLDFVS